MKKKRKRKQRSKTDMGPVSREARKYVDYDYLNSLSKWALKWLRKFSREYYSHYYGKKPIDQRLEGPKESMHREYIARQDVMNVYPTITETDIDEIPNNSVRPTAPEKAPLYSPPEYEVEKVYYEDGIKITRYRKV